MVISRVLIIFITAVLPFLCVTSKAQSVSDSISYVYSRWNAVQRKVMLTQLDLSESQKSAFVPLYDEYSHLMGLLETERLRLVELYTRNTEHMNDNKVQGMYGYLLLNDLERAKARIRYHRKFRRALTPALADRFMALDESLRSLFYLEQQRKVPALATGTIFSMHLRDR